MHTISTEELQHLIKNNGDYVLIDIREPHELAHGAIPTSHHIPMRELSGALDLAPDAFKEKYGFSLDKSSDLILYCRSGHRSAFAALAARKKGFNARSYQGSILAWSKIDPNVHAY